MSRGIGGIFFDDLNYVDQDTCYDFLKDAAEQMVPIYLPIVWKRKDGAYG